MYFSFSVKLIFFVSMYPGAFEDKINVIFFSYTTGDMGDIDLSRSDKLQSSGERVEIATIDVTLQNGGTKSQDDNHDSGKFK